MSRNSGPFWTEHSSKRASARRIDPRAVSLAIDHGKRVRQRGAVIYYLGRRHIPADLMGDPNVRRFEGTTVLVDNREQVILTVYRNRRGLR